MIEIIPLDFLGQGALLQPKHADIHDKAIEYCRRELRDDVNLATFSKVWIGFNNGTVFGVGGYVLRPDVPLFRFTDPDVGRALGKRLNDFFADQGWRGYQALLHIGNESAEQRCPEWRKVLKEFGAESGRRVSIPIR